jgi:hypothetical protein
MRLVHFGAGVAAVVVVYGYVVVVNFVHILHGPRTSTGLTAVSGGLNQTFALSAILVLVAGSWMCRLLLR